MDQAEKLRTMIRQQESVPGVARVITVTSGKGGVGKSSIAVNLALQMSREGKRVIILDADFGLANIEVMLGIRTHYTLADLMFHSRNLSDIITYGPENIGFISGGSGIREMANLSREQLLSLISILYELDSLADVIIVDTGAGIADTVLEFVASSSEVVLVATPEPTSITDAYALLKTLNKKEGFSANMTQIRLIGNRIQKPEEGEELFQKLNIVVDKFLNIDLQLLGMVPYDSMCQKAVMHQSPVSIEYPNAPSSQAFKRIADQLMDIHPNEEKGPKGIRMMFANLFKMKYSR